MAVESNMKNVSVFADVIKRLAIDATTKIDGIEILSSRNKSKFHSHGEGVAVYFLPNEKVAIDLFLNVEYGKVIPIIVAQVQDKVKNIVEGSTKFSVHSVNVQVVGVKM